MRTPPWLPVAAALAALALYYRHMLSATLEDQLAVYPAATKPLFRNLVSAFRARGYEVIVTSTVRPDQPASRHSTGHAIDLNVRKGGRQYFKATPKAEWEATGLPALARAQGFRWGGDFRTTPYDPVHFDLPRV